MRNALFVLAACAALMTGCGGGGGDSSDGGSTPPANNPRNINVNPTTVAFGTVAVGANADQTITVSNTGNATLTLGTITAPAASFSRNGGSCTNNQTLAAGANCTVVVRYTPGGTTTSNGSLNIASDDPEVGTGNGQNNVAVSLSGTGGLPNINVSSTSINFGTVSAGQSADQTITVSNNGTVALTLGTITTPAAPFSRQGGTCTNNQSLPAGANCTVIVRYAPTGTTTSNASFSIPSNDPDAGTANGQNNVSVSLSGTGTTAAIANINVNPTTVSFGTVAVGANADQTITVGNTGNTTLTLGTIGTPAAPFSRNGGTCTNNQTLAASASCTVIVRFAPSASGAANGSFNVPSNDPDAGTANGQNNVAVSLSGTGATPNINVSPTTVNFGSIAVGANADQTITVSNTGGVTLTLGTIGTPAAPFSRQGGSCTNGQTLAASASCTLIVRFTPSAAGAANTSFNVPSNDPDAGTANGQNNVLVSLTGTGNAPNISVSSTAVNFGTVTVGANADQTITVSNSGNADLTLGTIGSLTAPFSRQGGSCAASNQVLTANGGSCTLIVRFAPTVAGAANSSISIPSNDPDAGTNNGQNNVSVSLSGTGGTPPPSTAYHYYTGSPSATSAVGGLFAVGESAPATSLTVDANALANSSSPDITRVNYVEAGTVDAATGDVSNARNYTMVFAAGGQLWKQRTDQAPAPVRISNVSNIGTGLGNGLAGSSATDLCYLNTVADYATPENSLVIYGLAGVNATCGDTDDVYFWVRLSTGTATAPTALTDLPVAPVYSAAGAITNYLVINGATGTLEKRDANFGGAATVISTGPYAVTASDKEIWVAPLSPTRILLHLPPPCVSFPTCPFSGELRIVDTAANTLGNALGTTANRTAWDPQSRLTVDSSHVYFVSNNVAGIPAGIIQRFPVDGSAAATNFADAGAVQIYYLMLTTNRVVFTRQSGSSLPNIASIPKAGGAITTLASSTAGEAVALMGAGSTGFVYYIRIYPAIPPNISNLNRAEAIRDDGTGLVSFGAANGAKWTGLTTPSTYNFYRDSAVLDRMALMEYATSATTAAGATLSVVNADTATASGITLGTVPSDVWSLSGGGIGSRDLWTGYDGDYEVFYADFDVGGSLTRVTTDTVNQEVVGVTH